MIRVHLIQFELELNDVRSRIPWEGTSPRELTRGAKVLYLKRELGHEVLMGQLGQDDFFVEVASRPKRRRGDEGLHGAPSIWM